MTTRTAITPDLLTVPRKDTQGLRNLIGMSRDELAEALIAIGTPQKQAKMRVGQIWQWIYQRGVSDWDAMTNLGKDYRATLAEHFTLQRPEIVVRQISSDGTRKYLLKIAGGHDLSLREMQAVMSQIMTGESTQAQIGAFLMGLRMKGETQEEIVGSTRAMRANATAAFLRTGPSPARFRSSIRWSGSLAASSRS